MKRRPIHYLVLLVAWVSGCSLSHNPDLPSFGNGDGDGDGDGDINPGDGDGDGDAVVPPSGGTSGDGALTGGAPSGGSTGDEPLLGGFGGLGGTQ